MKLVKPSFEILTRLDGNSIIKLIEQVGRTCYKSESKITPSSAARFVEGIVKSGHQSVIEHFNVSVKIICDRGVTHELVRHRLCSFSQESTRYRVQGVVTFVVPPWLHFQEGEYDRAMVDCYTMDNFIWLDAMIKAEQEYLDLLTLEWTPQQARSVLPNSLKTEIVVTANLREWRHIFNLRTSSAAHPQMREIMVPLYEKFKEAIPEIYETLG